MSEPAPTSAADVTEPAPEPRAPYEPREGVPAVITTEAALLAYADRLAAGTGPLALDAERASGYRYSQRAYLVQMRREGAGTALIDPIAVPDLAPVQRGHRGCRVDPARRHPGSRLPRRGGPASVARCSTPSSPAGSSVASG